MLMNREEYLASGVHIGMRGKTKDMAPFIYYLKKNKLAILDINEVDKRITLAGKFLSNYAPEDILAVSVKEVGHKPVVMFSKAVGAKAVFGRFFPGMLTNPNSKEFIEPKIIIITDPVEDKQAIKEAVDARIPIIGLCDSANLTTNIDFIIPVNNKGKRSLGLVYFLLAKEYLKNRGLIKDDKELKYSQKDFTPE